MTRSFKRKRPILDGVVKLMKADLANFEHGQPFYKKDVCIKRYGVCAVTVTKAKKLLVFQGLLFQPGHGACYYIIKRDKEPKDEGMI